MLTLLKYLSLDLIPGNFWKFQDVKIDYSADLTGTGDRSEFDT